MRGGLSLKTIPRMDYGTDHYPQFRDVELHYTRPTLYYGRILFGEITPLLSAMKRATPRWSSSQQDTEQDPLVQQLRGLQMKITHLKPNSYLEPNIFLDPFLAIIRSEDTTGPVTKSALAAVNRMLNYGLIDPQHGNAVTAVESVAAAVTHARFLGTDQGADEVVLWEILTVLRTLILGPVGHLLTNESVCEILNSSFRICFETRLSELLRNCAEDALRHMVQLLFARLPQFKDDPQGNQNRKLKMRAGTNNEIKGKKGRVKAVRSSPPPSPTPTSEPPVDIEIPTTSDIQENNTPEDGELVTNASATSEVVIGDNTSVDSGITETTLPSPTEPLDISHTHLAPENLENQDYSASGNAKEESVEADLNVIEEEKCSDNKSVSSTPQKDRKESISLSDAKEEFINLQGVKFTQEGVLQDGNALVPYGLPCVREVFRFLMSLTSPTNDQNTSNMILISLNLLTVSLEVGAEHINHIPSLLNLIKNELCRNLFMLIKVEAKAPIFMASLRVCTLLFESLRTHLKFQLEMFINKLTHIITSESPNISYSYKELALETIVQLWRIPGLITELFLNFDCNLYSSNVFEDLTKVLSKNAFPVQGLYSTNLLSLEALLTVIEIIDSHCPPPSKKKKREEITKHSDDGQINSSRQHAVVAPLASGYLLGLGLLGGYGPVTPILKARSCIVGTQEISRESLLAIKEKKKLLAFGTDQFNVKPEKGIQFLQDNGIIGLSNDDIAVFIRENPHLDKKVIGEYVSKKKNVAILSAFVKSFDFRGLRIDECLRMFLETFRLPGEAPVISIIIEHFSSHWHNSNGTPFEKEDAAFTLAYAVIMLNVDQHNQNAKKQNIPMTLDQFRNNLRGVNNGKDFDKKMLEEIYCAIHSEEIVMPAEQTGLVKENYLWKMLLKRGTSREGEYLLTNRSNNFDKDLFSLCWGPTVASLSYVFDKSQEDPYVAISGFMKCASIAARYGMSDVFDNLVVTLCKFTTLTQTSNDSPEQVAVSFGGNVKAQLAARTVFRLVTSHGDILRDGWKNILELLLQLFRCRLLSSKLIESEDFVEPSGKVSLVREVPINIPRVESGLLSSLYSYIALGDVGSTRGTTPEDVELMECAKKCIRECHPEKLITESAFLRYDSLNELLKSMMGAGDANNMAEVAITPVKPQVAPGSPQEISGGLDEYGQAFLLELVVSVLVANKDRAGGVWPSVRDHIYSLLMSAAAAERYFLLERCIVAVLKVAKVLLRRPELANPILQSLRMLLLLGPHILYKAALQVVSGIFEVLSVNADHIRDPSDWAILFALLECSGAGAKPPPIVNPESQIEPLPELALDSDGPSSGVDSGHCTETCEADSGLASSPGVEEKEHIGSRKSSNLPSPSTENVENSIGKPSRGPSPETIQNPGGWILVGREGEIEPVPARSISVNEWDIVHQRILGDHKPEALVKAVDTLSFLVRERHITKASLPSVVQACRTFVEATLNGVKLEKRCLSKESLKSPNRRKIHSNRKKEEKGTLNRRPKSPTSPNSNAYDADESDNEDVPVSYQQVSEKLLDLMDTLHTSSSHILNHIDENEVSKEFSWNHSVSLWHQSLCPLLQGIARYCCDTRSSIRNLAMTYLQRALLNHDLQTLSAVEWESCFNKVLFPLLAKLLQPLGKDVSANGALEETRVRAATLVQKVYLRHLTPLLTLPTFTALWLTILDFMDKYLNTHKSDHLVDAIPEILKNMLLVMETTQVFHTSEGFTHLWSITWDRIDAFLPNFRHDLFKSHPPSEIHRLDMVSSEIEGKHAPSGGGQDVKEDTCPSSPLPETEVREKDAVTPHTPPEPAAQEQQPLVHPPTLQDQGALRLSLNQENVPDTLGSNFILQPPLPQILPVSSPLAPPAVLNEPLCTKPATLLHQDLFSNLSSLPRFVPPISLYPPSSRSTLDPPSPHCTSSPSYLHPNTSSDSSTTLSVVHITDSSILSPVASSESFSTCHKPQTSIEGVETERAGPKADTFFSLAGTQSPSNVNSPPQSWPLSHPLPSVSPPLELHHPIPVYPTASQSSLSINPFESTSVSVASLAVSDCSPPEANYPDISSGDRTREVSCSGTDIMKKQTATTPSLRPASLLFSQSSHHDFPISATLKPFEDDSGSLKSTLGGAKGGEAPQSPTEDGGL